MGCCPLQSLRMAYSSPSEGGITLTPRPLGEQTQRTTRGDAQLPHLRGRRRRQAGTCTPALTQRSNREQSALCSTAFTQKRCCCGFLSHSGIHRRAGRALFFSCDLRLPCRLVLGGNQLAEPWAKDKQAGLIKRPYEQMLLCGPVAVSL